MPLFRALAFRDITVAVIAVIAMERRCPGWSTAPRRIRSPIGSASPGPRINTPGSDVEPNLQQGNEPGRLAEQSSQLSPA